MDNTFTFDRNTVLAASAGTGKTFTLVQAYVQLLEEGRHPQEIVAITFTEKAAAELRDRVRKAVYAQADISGNAAQWLRALTHLPSAPVSTIHGFCTRVLREHGSAIGIDPSFTVLDEQTSLDLCRDAAADAVRDGVRRGLPEVEALFRDFGLEGLVDTCIEAILWLNSLGVDAGWLEQRAQVQQAEASALREALARELEKLPEDLEGIGELADRVVITKLRKHPLYDRKNPNALLPRIGQIFGTRTALHLAVLIREAQRIFASIKRERNGLDFDDLLIGVRDLLKNVEPVRGLLRKQYSAVLVDEFQDTDEVQAEIVEWLTSTGAREDPLSPGKLLIAGDPKQSIYRFRRAQVTVFMRVVRRIEREGGRIYLLQNNYRSAAELCEFSNALSRMMLDGTGKKNLLDEVAVDLSYRIRFDDRDLLRAKAPAEFEGITYLTADPSLDAASGRKAEAAAIAQALRRWRDEGALASWREVAVLMRTMTFVGVFENALAAEGIPTYVVQGTGFYQRPEVSDLIALLEYVLRPGDKLTRATVLTSAFGGLTFDDLHDGAPAEEFDRAVSPWITRRDSATAAEILEDVIRRLDFDVIQMAMPDGEQRMANMGKLIELTRDLARSGTTSLDEIVHFLKVRANDPDIRVPEAQTLGHDHDVVRIMTVHLAKGLEFDTVVLPLTFGRASTGRTVFRSERWGLLAAASYGLHRETLPHALILKAGLLDADQDHEEEKRLLYVAVTRARKRLLLSEGRVKREASWRDWVTDLMEEIQPGAVDLARNGTPTSVVVRSGNRFSIDLVPPVSTRQPTQLSLPVNGPAGAIAPALPPPPAPVSPLQWNGTVEISATQLARSASREENRAGTRDSDARRLGILAHEAIEQGTLSGRADLPEVAALLESPEWKEIAKGPLERELPFLLHFNVDGRDCIVHGRIDAVVPHTDPRVIDYKLAEWAEGRENEYRVPMTVYSLAILRATGAETATAELWYLKPALRIVRWAVHRQDAEAEVVDRIRNYLRSLVPEEPRHNLLV